MFLDGECTDITSSKYGDINTITSVLKLYFQLLPKPLVTILLFSMFLDGECTDITSSKYGDINTITSVLKLYFRLLPIPFMTILLFSMFLDGECTDITCSKYGDINTITSVLKLYFQLLPKPLVTILLFSMFLDGECTDITSSKYDDINTITSVLKLYFRLLPIPLVTFEGYAKLMEASGKMYMSLCFFSAGQELIFCHVTSSTTFNIFLLRNTICNRYFGDILDNDYRCMSDCRSRGRKLDPGPVPYFHGDRIWNNFYRHSFFPLIHSRRVVVSYKRKYVHQVLVNGLFKLAQEKVWLGELTIPTWP